ncbi:MAG: DUF1549 and DUF1553 domain-containing protein [Gemmataceae bacterium]|nr:DUF1549 and DUF1553 domain-containing protein [Gemmataceae bacterium]MCI0739761.1 DUF1549 and DUF1553 domain-containing protein [Gemmataceae bacterium]
MAMESKQSVQRLSWSKTGATASLFAIGAFVALSLWAKWNPVQAQEATQKKQPERAAAAKLKTALEAKQAQAGAKEKGKGKQKNKAEGQAKTKPATPPNFTVPGAGKKLDHLALAKIIDQEVKRRLDAEGIKLSPKTDDAEFLRRVYLDIAGVIPTPEKVEEFLNSKDANKREKVIDELLNDPRFGKAMAEAWSGQMIPRESNNRRLDHSPLQKWLAEKFNDGTSLNKIVYELVTSEGPQDENGAVTYFVGNPTVDKMTDNVTRMFMGVQLQCAQCHNHPFVDWKQTEYWAMAAFFMKTRLTVNPQQAAKKGIAPGISETGPAKGKKGNLPESAKFVPAKFLQGDQPKLDPKEPYRPVLAQWLTSASNPYFAKAMANRFWYQLFGRGLVNPVDDMHEDNPASHPELLAALTEQFKNSSFDVRYLIKAICNSDTYQRTSRPYGDNQDDSELYSHRIVRVLSAEQLYDSLVTVVGNVQPKKGDVKNKAVVAKKAGPGGPRENFLVFFRIDEGVDPLEYQAGIPQALRLMNSPQSNATNAAVAKSMGEGKTPQEIIQRLYLTGLSRRPSDEELRRMTQYLTQQGDPRTAYNDILWALINSSEFATNH